MMFPLREVGHLFICVHWKVFPILHKEDPKYGTWQNVCNKTVMDEGCKTCVHCREWVKDSGTMLEYLVTLDGKLRTPIVDGATLENLYSSNRVRKKR
jgi:hypothetical protein